LNAEEAVSNYRWIYYNFPKMNDLAMYVRNECVVSLNSDQHHLLLAASGELLLQVSEGVSFPDATHVCERENCKNIETNKAEHDEEVAPVVRILNVEPSRHVLVSSPEGAEQTCRSGVRVSEITASKRYELVHIFATSGSTGRIYRNELMRSTVNVLVTDSLTEQTFDEVGKRGNMVHPLPPTQFTERLQDTVKRNDKREQRAE